MPNRLIHEKSPYLRQHANNPVDWYPWGEEAFRRAKELDRPIFLSIGYSACHWCHVMEKESFADPEVAAVLNQHFVSIKVDREEHPAVDAQYMEAVQIITGQGGWPLSVFLTPDLQPFYGGTYWPREARFGMPGFLDVLRAIADAWEKRRHEVVAEADKVTVLLSDISNTLPGRHLLSEESVLQRAEQVLAEEFDPRWGGFGVAPKFPHPSVIRYLLTRFAFQDSQMALTTGLRTLDAMADGGMYDHVGGGFHRYSTDAMWMVPHFEKMLYDNALLARAYLDAWRLTRCERYGQIVNETLDYLLRDMHHSDGGFYASQDADSEGHEGQFYLWTYEEILNVLGPAAERFAEFYDITREGSFEGKNIPNRIRSANRWTALSVGERAQLEQEMAELRQRLRETRQMRTPPDHDDKIVLAWNAFAAEVFLLAGRVFDEERYLTAGTMALEFLLSHLRDERGMFCHSWCQGVRGTPAVLEDEAALAVALITGYETMARRDWLEIAVTLVEDMRARFHDAATGVFFMTPADHPHLLCRRLDYFDNPTPSGTALAAEAMLRLGHLGGEPSYLAIAEGALRSLAGWMQKSPIAVGHALFLRQTMVRPWTSWMFVLPSGEVGAVHEGKVPPPVSRWLSSLMSGYNPSMIVSINWLGDGSPSSATDGLPGTKSLPDRPAVNGEPTLYICQGPSCGAPIVGEQLIEKVVQDHVSDALTARNSD